MTQIITTIAHMPRLDRGIQQGSFYYDFSDSSGQAAGSRDLVMLPKSDDNLKWHMNVCSQDLTKIPIFLEKKQ